MTACPTVFAVSSERRSCVVCDVSSLGAQRGFSLRWFSNIKDCGALVDSASEESRRFFGRFYLTFFSRSSNSPLFEARICVRRNDV